MIITNLASGSKGNATIVETEEINILIDAGLPLSNLKKRLKKPFPKIDVLIITHTHTDHIKGIESIVKKYNPIIYTGKNDLYQKVQKGTNINQDNNFKLASIEIETFNLSHDVPCIGIKIKDNEHEIIYITDTGYIKEKTLEKIKNKDMYIIESNYDEEMLMNGSYPFYLKQRIRSPKGHLSNDDTVRYLKQLIGPKTKYISLAHLSEENNNPVIVEKNVKQLTSKHKNIKKVKVYKQDEVNETIL